jgi:putative flippase GtrA
MGSLVNAAFGLYLLVGALATAVHYAVLLVLVEAAGLPAAPSAAFGAICGALAAYAGNHRYTFSRRAKHRRALPRFLTVAAAAAAANGALVWAGTVPLGLHYLAAQVLATAVIVTGGFALNRGWSFA